MERRREEGRGKQEEAHKTVEWITKLETSCIYILANLFEIYKILQISEEDQCCNNLWPVNIYYISYYILYIDIYILYFPIIF